MLPVHRLSQRAAVSIWPVEFHHWRRCFSDDKRPFTRSKKHQFTAAQKARWKGKEECAQAVKEEPKEPSLVEQLFPEISKRDEEQQAAAREVPRVPLPNIDPHVGSGVKRQQRHTTRNSLTAQQQEADMEAAGPGSAVLVLRNASPNLTEEDFRRLVPQGRHLEGWRLEQGDILKVIPGQNLANLGQQNVYYLLFTSALNAFTYQGHVQRIHNLAALHTPSSVTSPIPPPPGYMIEGLDAHAAIQAYTLVPPTQKLELRQLKPPLAPVIQTLVRHGGWKSVKDRDGKMPYEVRLTMEGPQIGPSMVRHILMESGRQRGLSWNGGEGLGMKITRWTPQLMPSPIQNDERAWAALEKRTEKEQMDMDVARARQSSQDPAYAELKRRTPPEVYILGFHTERAAQSFVAHWHKRPLEMDPISFPDWDASPIANVSMLW